MKKVLMLLSNGFEAVEASVFTDVLGWNKLEGDGTTRPGYGGTSRTIEMHLEFHRASPN